MNVLVIGSGGREHALVHHLAVSPRVAQVFAAPGNDGMAKEATLLATTDYLAAAKHAAADLVVIGPEQPLVDGVADDLRAAGFTVFGPGGHAAQLEGSKAFAKAFMQKYALPTARWERVNTAPAAKAVLAEFSTPIVLKIDGLAAGKGVTIHDTHEAAAATIDELYETNPTQELVIEEFLHGIETSLLLIVNETGCTVLPYGQDYKQAFNGDKGPMTGGMGVVAPVTYPELAHVEMDIIKPLLHALEAEGLSYRGVLYVGLMLTAAGPKILEFNVRFGDPETQALLPLLADDPAELLLQAATGKPLPREAATTEEYSACIILASDGYPDRPKTGKPVALPATMPDHTTLYFAGLRAENGTYVTAGGRVLAIVSTATTQDAALERAYEVTKQIAGPGVFYRDDIGFRLAHRTDQSGKVN